MEKISTRFFKDRMMRAVWDDSLSKWWFSVLDVVGIINQQDDYLRNRNYWKYLKTKAKKENSELVSVTNQFKLLAPDGKRRLADVLDADGIIKLAKTFPNSKAVEFLEWFTYSDNTIDGQSRKKAYTLFEGNMLDSIEEGTVKGLKQIHAYLFGGLYEFAGQIRTKTISKGGFTFCPAQYLTEQLSIVERMKETSFDEIVNKYVEMNVCHPFMEGNGRTMRIWLDLMFKVHLHQCVDWSKIGKVEYLNAMTQSVADSRTIKQLLHNALTSEIHSREMFMKGIDYSYYYEQEE